MLSTLFVAVRVGNNLTKYRYNLFYSKIGLDKIVKYICQIFFPRIL